MEKMIETRRLDELTPHPQNLALYGDSMHEVDEQLVESMQKHGIWEGEIQITTGNVIISGHRRHANAALAEIVEAAVWIRTDLPEDPMHPDVLSAVLDANIQRVKTNEQRVREWDLRMEVERKRARERMNWRKTASDKEDGSCLGQNIPGMNDKSAVHRSRDLAAKACGLDFAGRHIQDAAKALKAADEAMRSDDPEVIRKGQMVKSALNDKVTKAIKTARFVGLLPPVQPRKLKEPSKPKPQASEPEPQPKVEAVPEPEPQPEQEPQPGKLPPGLANFSTSQRKYFKERLDPALRSTVEAYALLCQERDRLRKAYGHPATGSLIHTQRFQQVAASWAVDGTFDELAELMGSHEATIDSLLLRLEELGKHIAGMADLLRMFTGCRKDNNRHG